MKHIGEAIRNTFSNRKRMIWIIIIGTAMLLLVIGGIQAYRILYTPQNLFNVSTMSPNILATQNATPEPTPEFTLEPEGTELSPEPEGTETNINQNTVSPSPSAAPTIAPTPDITANSDVLNILLIGIDRSQTKGKGSGRDPHADVMMVVAIHFKDKKVDLISLPRDTFIHAPEIMNGVYKLNASFNVGGGFAAKNGGGFLKVCEAAEYMLGGIPVDYYYAVDFTSLVNVVNTIGGVDYEVENRAYSRDNIKGMQHMDGNDVLFYVRSRKVGPEQGDPNRVNRQKKMMIAVFKQLTEKGKLSMVPDLVSAANNGVYTNTNIQQTLALANFAKTISTDKIKMHSMTGHYSDYNGWRYCFTEQKERQVMIKQIYGINVPEQVRCSTRYADWLSDYGFSAIRYQKTAKQLLDYVDAHKADFTAQQQKAYAALAAAYTKTQSAFDRASIALGSTNNRALANEKKKLKTSTEELARLLGYKEKLTWTFDYRFWLDPAINEVNVDFR